MKFECILIASIVLLFVSCKKETGVTSKYIGGTQIDKIYDADVSGSGAHDNATFCYFYDSNNRVNLIKEYDTTLNASLVVVKINYRKIQYAYDAKGKVTIESVTSYSPVISNITTKYFYDVFNRMKKKEIYSGSVFTDSTVYTYLTNKIVSKYGINVVDTFYLNSVTQNLDSTYFGAGGSTYRYIMDDKINIFRTHDFALNPYDINPYRCDYNIRKVKTSFGNFNYKYTYNPNNYPASYSTILGSGSGCLVTFYYK